MDFEIVLVCLVAISGIISLLDRLFWAKKRGDNKPNFVVEYGRSFFPVLLAVLLLRSFLVEPYRIPSGSLEPTLLVGDLIAVNKFTYGIRLPIIGTKLLNISTPKVGDIMVFRWPADTSIDYIKRIIGTPGDHVVYQNKKLTVNGKEATQKFVEYTTDSDGHGNSWKVGKYEETIAGVTHDIYIRDDVPSYDFDVIVPPNSYFAMGDNRDDSADSRFWGFVPDHNIIGKAFAVWMSWDSAVDNVRWSRIGSLIK